MDHRLPVQLIGDFQHGKALAEVQADGLYAPDPRGVGDLRHPALAVGADEVPYFGERFHFDFLPRFPQFPRFGFSARRSGRFPAQIGGFSAPSGALFEKQLSINQHTTNPSRFQLFNGGRLSLHARPAVQNEANRKFCLAGQSKTTPGGSVTLHPPARHGVQRKLKARFAGTG
jgi:hypothetical protein